MTRTGLRWLLAVFYAFAGYKHLAEPPPFLLITPAWVPLPEAVVALTGVAELMGAAALLQPWSSRLRRTGGWGFALYAACVFPANINHFAIDMARADNGLGLVYHIPRMIAQPLLVWLALWVSHAIDWPFIRTKKGERCPSSHTRL